MLSELLTLQDYKPELDSDKKFEFEKITVKNAGKTEVYEYRVKSPDTIPKWHNICSDQTGDTQPVPQNAILWYFHASNKELTLVMSGIISEVHQGRDVFPANMSVDLSNNTKQSLDDICFSSDELHPSSGLVPAINPPFVPTEDNIVILIFAGKPVSAQMRVGENKKVSFYDVNTGKKITEKLASLNQISAKTTEQTTTVFSLIAKAIKGNIRGQLSSDCTETEWKNSPQKLYFAAIIVWIANNVVEISFGAFITLLVPCLLSKMRHKNNLLPQEDRKKEIDGNTSRRKTRAAKRRRKGNKTN